jgi:hypothetical protein
MIEVQDFLTDLTKIKVVVCKDDSVYMSGKEFLEAIDTNGVKDITNLDRNNFEDWFLFFEIQLQWYIFIDYDEAYDHEN